MKSYTQKMRNIIFFAEMVLEISRAQLEETILLMLFMQFIANVLLCTCIIQLNRNIFNVYMLSILYHHWSHILFEITRYRNDEILIYYVAHTEHGNTTLCPMLL